jgi:hypothetical protein
MTQWQLNHFLDLCQLLTAATDVIVSDSVECFFFLLRNKNKILCDYKGSLTFDKMLCLLHA